jgi:phosphoribosylanthranilate isomerase
MLDPCPTHEGGVAVVLLLAVGAERTQNERPMVRVKVCCIGSVDEARLAIAAGASALGLVSEMPSGPGVIDEGLIEEIVSFTPPSIATFLLTSRTGPTAVADQVRRTRVNTVQLCDRMPPGAHAELRATLPGVSLVQVIHVTGEESVAEAVESAGEVDTLLLDSGNQSLDVKELGGTGRAHDWSLSERIVRAVPVPVFLAGGLGPDNVEEAIRRVRPFGVDLCSGVRTDGALDADLLGRFMKAVAEAST